MKNPEPLISIIVPVYNTAPFLQNCVSSIMHQTYKNLEILLIDDGSTDGSEALCDAFAAEDDRIKVMHKANGGQADARNLALDIATGEYIGFVDSDDTIELDMYQELIAAINAYGCDVAMCARYNVFQQTQERMPIFTLNTPQVWETEETIRRFLTWDNIDGSPCDKLFTRSLLDDVRFPLGLVSEDIPFVYEALKKAKSIVHIGTPKYNYLQRENSTSRSRITEKTMGLVKYPAEIREKVKKEYPALNKYADYFYFSRELLYIEQLYREGHKSTATERMRIVRKNSRALLSNKNFSGWQRLRIILIDLHLYKLAYRIFLLLKGKRL